MKCLVSVLGQQPFQSIFDQHPHHVLQSFQSFSLLCNAMSRLSAGQTNRSWSGTWIRRVRSGSYFSLNVLRNVLSTISTSSSRVNSQCYLLNVVFVHGFLCCASFSACTRANSIINAPTSTASCCISSLFGASQLGLTCLVNTYHIH